MPYYWSENARIGLQFLSKWNLDSIIQEEEIVKIEKQLNYRFPEILRRFYMDWGNHLELTKTVANIYRPFECEIRTNHLMISEENQWVYSHGIKLSDLKNPNPPLEYVVNGEETDSWRLSHAKVSDHLDGILFGHAFALRTLSGAYGWFQETRQKHPEKVLIGKGFSKIVLDSNVLGLEPQFGSEWPIYHNYSTIVIFYPTGMAIKALAEENIDALEKLFDLKWQDRW